MKTQLVKALDVLKHPLPMVVKGLRGLYEVTKVVAEDGRVTCYRTTSHGKEIATLRKPYDGLFEVVIADSADTDLLRKELVAAADRNIALREDNATLTRRVQELEAQNEELKQRAGYCVDEGCDHSHILHQCFSGSQLSDRAVDAIIADVLKPEPTAADQKLQADIDALHVRLQRAEQRMPTPKEIGTVVHDTVERMLQPGGLLYRGLK